MTQTTEERLAWCAGYISGKGSLLMYQGRPALRVKETGHPESMAKFVEYTAMGIHMKRLKPNKEVDLTYYCQVTGERCHELMWKLWPYLTTERKKEYARLRRQAYSSPQ